MIMQKQPQGEPSPERTYNERLFSGGLRRHLHMARFFWVRRKLDQLGLLPNRVLEIGCHDGRALNFLPRTPVRYVGLDADWENGLELAARRWSGRSGFEFRRCQRASEMQLGDERFDVALALETLEHIPHEDLVQYLESVADVVRSGGVFLVTVPNEKGIVFITKHFLKVTLIGKPQKYSFSEVFWQSVGLTGRVRRHEHKGFDHRRLIRVLARRFNILRVEGIPMRVLPPSLNVTVGIVCRPRS